MGFLKTFLKLFEKPSVSPTPVQRKGSLLLCNDLNYPESLRLELDRFIRKKQHVRSEGLVAPFFDIINKAGYPLSFPSEIYDILNSRRKRGKCTDKQVAAVYIRHEISKLQALRELENAKELGVRYIYIRTARDGDRVCQACRVHEGKRYPINMVPVLPLCWECRCYYEPVIE